MIQVNILEMTASQLIAHKKQVCKKFGCTMDQLNKQYAANAAQLQRMADKAASTGKKVNNYTAAQLQHHSATYQRLAA